MADRKFIMNKPDAGSADHRQPAERMALLIANAEYHLQPLANPLNDVEAIDKVLKNLDFETTVVRNAGKAAIEAAVTEFGRRAARQAAQGISFLFYSGHGLQHHGRNYLIPVDAKIKSEDEIPEAAVPLDTILAKVANGRDTDQRATVIVLDACRNYSTEEHTEHHGLAEVRSIEAGTLLAFSTGAGAVAKDGRPGTTSP